MPIQGQPPTSFADLEDCVHADSFDMGKHYCKAQSHSKSSTTTQSASTEAKKSTESQKSTETQKQEIKQTTSTTVDSSAKATQEVKQSSDLKLNDGCVGDFAFDHLKQQENLSLRTLKDLENKELQYERELNQILRQQPQLQNERRQIENLIKSQLNKRDQITRDYQNMLAQFAEEERRQQQERQRKELIARRDEQAKLEAALRETKVTTERAYKLKRREFDFKTEKEDLEQNLKEIKPALESIRSHLQYVRHQQELVKSQSNRQNFRRLYKEQLHINQRSWEADRDRKIAEHNRLQATCNPNKIRTYACQVGSNTQTVKYFNYEYDQNQGQCIEKVQTKQQECKPDQKLVE